MKKIILGLFTLVLAGAGCATAVTDSPEVAEGDVVVEDTALVVEETQVQPEEQVEVVDNAPQEKAAKYVSYNEDTFSADVEEQPALLFFHANWCPTCRSAESDIEKNIDDLPDGLTIYKADYDSERTLKKKYAVTTQHTFVQVDSSGNEVAKWIGGGVPLINQQLK